MEDKQNPLFKLKRKTKTFYLIHGSGPFVAKFIRDKNKNAMFLGEI